MTLLVNLVCFLIVMDGSSPLTFFVNFTCMYIQSNLSYVTVQGNIELGSHKTGWSLNTGLIHVKCAGGLN